MKIGDIVNYHIAPNDKPVNGSHVHPAMVVAAHSDDCVNLKVFLDGKDDLWATSVTPARIEGDKVSQGFSLRE